jgi:hypothetical protein
MALLDGKTIRGRVQHNTFPFMSVRVFCVGDARAR